MGLRPLRIGHVDRMTLIRAIHAAMARVTRGHVEQLPSGSWRARIYARSVIVTGLASTLPAALHHGLIAQGVPPADAAWLAALPPVSILFAALLGYNPIQQLLGPVVAKLPPGHAATLTGHTFLPSLISPSFQHGLDIAFDFAIACCLIAAVASLLRGGRYVYDEHSTAVEKNTEAPELVGRNDQRGWGLIARSSCLGIRSR